VEVEKQDDKFLKMKLGTDIFSLLSTLLSSSWIGVF